MIEEIFLSMDVIAFNISILALLLYVRDKIKVEPVIQQVFVRRLDDNPPNHQIQLLLVNIGEKKANECNVDLRVNGNKVGSLVFPTVDSPIGRVGIDWAVENRFTLYPKAPIWVRGYTNAQLDDKIEVILKMGNKICDLREFSLRFTTDTA